MLVRPVAMLKKVPVSLRLYGFNGGVVDVGVDFAEVNYQRIRSWSGHNGIDWGRVKPVWGETRISWWLKKEPELSDLKRYQQVW